MVVCESLLMESDWMIINLVEFNEKFGGDFWLM